MNIFFRSDRGEEEGLDMGHSEAWQSLSCLTDSTEQSAPVNFDMSNRVILTYFFCMIISPVSCRQIFYVSLSQSNLVQHWDTFADLEKIILKFKWGFCKSIYYLWYQNLKLIKWFSISFSKCKIGTRWLCAF